MTRLEKSIVIILVQIVPLATGYILKRRGRAKEEWGRPLSRFIVSFFNTSVAFLAAWILPRRLGMVKLPVISILYGGIITLVALAMSRLHRSHSKPDRGSYVLGTVISNYGFTLGGFICLIFLGEKALSMQTIYIFPLVGFIYLVWFPISRYYGTTHQHTDVLSTFLRTMTEITSLPMAGIIAGLALNFSGIERPGFFSYITPVLVYTGTAASTFCIGVTLQPGSVGHYVRENLTVAFSKFVSSPLIGFGLATLMGLEGIQRQVVVILTAVPVGLFSAFGANIYGLNRNMSNSLFIVNTALFLFVVLPVLVWLLPYMV